MFLNILRKKPGRYIYVRRPDSGGGRPGVDRGYPRRPSGSAAGAASVYNLRLPTEGLRQGNVRVAGARIIRGLRLTAGRRPIWFGSVQGRVLSLSLSLSHSLYPSLSLYPPLSLSLCLFLCLCLCLSVCLSLCLSRCRGLALSLSRAMSVALAFRIPLPGAVSAYSLFVRFAVSFPPSLSLCLSVCLSVCPSVGPSVRRSVSLSLSLCHILRQSRPILGLCFPYLGPMPMLGHLGGLYQVILEDTFCH